MTRSGRGRVGGAGGCPTVGAGIVPVRRCSSRWTVVSAPDDHFAAGPHCRVTVSARGRVGGAGGCPTVGAGIISPAGVQMAAAITPPQTIISLPVQTAVCTFRAEGALVSVVGVHVSSVQPPEGLAITGSVVGTVHLNRLGIDCQSTLPVFGICSSAVRRDSRRPVWCWADKSAIKRSVNTGLAKHSAMTKGSFPRASNSSRRTSGCLV